MSIESAILDRNPPGHMATAAYMAVSVLSGMAMLFFMAAMGYGIIQLIQSLA